MNSKDMKLYEITAYTENHAGLLSAIAGIFARRSLNIEKLLVYPSDVPGIHKFKILTRCEDDKIENVVLQIEKKVDVLKAFYHVNNEYSGRESQLVRELVAQREKEENNK